MLTFTAVPGIPEVPAGASLPEILATALDHAGMKLAENDVVVFCQKVVSKAGGRLIRLAEVEPSPRALGLARICKKDPRLVELVLRESTEVVRCVKDVLIVRHRLGFVVANAAIDQSNVAGDGQYALLLPEDPDASALRLRREIYERLGVKVAVLISDSFGRPWRMGVCGVCIGCAGMQPLLDKRGMTDRFGRKLEVTQIAAGDEIVAAATLVMGEADEGQPVVIVSGVPATYFSADRPASSLVRQLTEDLFK